MSNNLPLAGQHAVVTGAGRGIGAAISEKLASLGAPLTLMGRTRSSLETQRNTLATRYGGDVISVVVDVRSTESVTKGFDKAKLELGDPAILVNNAGIAESAPFLDADEDHWHRILDIDLLGPVRCSRQVLPPMREAGYGRIVNIASTAGLKGYAYVSAYTAAKHGLIGFTRSLALETARSGITVNAVCPGFTDTDLLSNTVENIVETTGRTESEAQAALMRDIPMGRFILPDEVAQAVAWLCLPESGAITGQSIIVAGGELM